MKKTALALTTLALGAVGTTQEANTQPPDPQEQVNKAPTEITKTREQITKAGFVTLNISTPDEIQEHLDHIEKFPVLKIPILRPNSLYGKSPEEVERKIDKIFAKRGGVSKATLSLEQNPFLGEFKSDQITDQGVYYITRSATEDFTALPLKDKKGILEELKAPHNQKWLNELKDMGHLVVIGDSTELARLNILAFNLDEKIADPILTRENGELFEMYTEVQEWLYQAGIKPDFGIIFSKGGSATRVVSNEVFELLAQASMEEEYSNLVYEHATFQISTLLICQRFQEAKSIDEVRKQLEMLNSDLANFIATSRTTEIAMSYIESDNIEQYASYPVKNSNQWIVQDPKARTYTADLLTKLIKDLSQQPEIEIEVDFIPSKVPEYLVTKLNLPEHDRVVYMPQFHIKD